MTEICIISDNYYFAQGIRYSLPPDKLIRVCTPDEFLEKNPKYLADAHFIFIKNRMLYRKVCRYLTGKATKLFFFSPALVADKLLCRYFLWAKMDVRLFKMLVSSYLRSPRSNYIGLLSFANQRRVLKLAMGVDSYMLWEKNSYTTKCKKYYERHKVVQLLGLPQFSIQNMYIAEDIASGLLTASAKA